MDIFAFTKARLKQTVKHLGILGVTLVATSLNAASLITEKKIQQTERYIQQAMEELKLPGLAVGLIENGQPRLLKGYGVRNSQGDPMTPQTSVELGSTSKSFTALAIMQLAQQNQINIDAPVIDYIPWFKANNKSQSDKILIRHLLNHRSGFSNLDGNRNLLLLDNSADANKQAVADFAQYQLIFEPGETYHYSNINYQILAYILEVVTGKSYESVIEENLFKPLSMANSFAAESSGQHLAIAEGFQFQFGEVIPSKVEQGRATIAQGRLKVSAEDMLKYLNEFMPGNNEFVPGNQGFIHSSTKQEILKIPEQDARRGYGMGWIISHKADHRIIYHFGRSFGFETVVMFSPELNVGMVALANAHSGFARHNVGALLIGIGNIMLGEKPAKVASPLVEKILFYSLFVIPGLILMFAINFWRNYRTGQQFIRLHPLNIIEVLTRLALPTVMLLGLAYLILVFLPKQYAVTLDVVALSEPTLYFGMILCASIALGWCLLRSLLIGVQLNRSSILHQ